MTAVGIASIKDASTLPKGALWAPVEGAETTKLMAKQAKLSPAAKAATTKTAASILGRGQDPTGSDGHRTGLVVGYVQSGKTLSFTTVIAMARDNNIPLVIVIAGTSQPLFNQTYGRLAEDLQIGEDEIPPSWLHVQNPDVNKSTMIQKKLDDWKDEELGPEDNATILLTVMKQHQRLQNLDDLLVKLDLTGIPAIVIDDEADQASLNTAVNNNAESPTYQKLINIKSRLPNHTYLQYTATPQAPLLINIIDALSPDFVQVLDPGEGYVGGVVFFGHDGRYIKPIPAKDVPSKNNVITDAPHSLIKALAFFYVSVAVGLIEKRSKENPNRSMLVHPARTTNDHLNYYTMISSLKGDWLALLEGSHSEPDFIDLMKLLKEAYDDLATTTADLPSFDEVSTKLKRALKSTQVEEVNRRSGQPTPKIEWGQVYAWILVGGQAMDRGFTVRELSVTYMPRGAGVGNADTLQQRARFFGYKKRYLGHCRIYLESDVTDLFKSYVRHEEEMRKELLALQESGESLSNWKRRFILDPSLKPCRSNVIEHDYGRGNLSDDWFYPHLVRMTPEAIAKNRQTVIDFASGLTWTLGTSGATAPAAQSHDVVDEVPLGDVLEKLLVDYVVQGAKDTANHIGVMLQLEKARTELPDETAKVFNMRPSYKSRRKMDDQGRISSIRRIHQGPTKVAGGYSYPGDIAFKDNDRVSVQIHHFDLTEVDGGPIISANVPVVAIWVPKRLQADWLVQEQPD